MSGQYQLLREGTCTDCDSDKIKVELIQLSEPWHYILFVLGPSLE